jgi:hypothetical protein
MKRLVLFLGITVLTAAITLAIPKQEKQATLTLSRGELEAIYQIVDDAAVPGAVRKPLLEKIMRAYQSAFPQTTQGNAAQQKKDSTSKPKNK